MPIPDFNESEYLHDSNNVSGLYVKKFGYEIEGLFKSQFGNQSDDECECSSDTLEQDGCMCGSEDQYDNLYFKEDGSVHCRRTYNGDEQNTIEGEIASPVWRIDRMNMFENFVESNKPFYTDRTAGIHVSISTNNTLAYEKLMDAKYFKLFRKSVKQFMNMFKPETTEFLFCEKTRKLFNDRFNGIYDTYCKNSYAPDSQVNPTWQQKMPNHHGRYNCMSYPHNDNGRLECRMFPSSSITAEIILMVEWFVNFTNSYLNTFTQSERMIGSSIEVDESHIESNEDWLICV